MNEQKHRLDANGIPRLENVSKEVFKTFCTAILSVIEEEHLSKKESENKDIDNNISDK